MTHLKWSHTLRMVRKCAAYGECGGEGDQSFILVVNKLKRDVPSEEKSVRTFPNKVEKRKFCLAQMFQDDG